MVVRVIKMVREKNNDVPFIFFTGHGNEQLMMEAAKYGAFDFLDKPNLDGLKEVISKGLSEGFKRSHGGETEVEADFMSRYQQILNQLEKK